MRTSRANATSIPLILVPALALTLGACRGATTAMPEPEAHAETHSTAAHPVRRVVGTDPGHVGRGTPLAPAEGHALAAFSAGCFWGVEDNFRQVPGVLATAVG